MESVKRKENKARILQMQWKEIDHGIYEINEFNCSSMFVIEGTECALVIDAGVGIGDLKGFIQEYITDKPLKLLLSHNHGDHMGGAPWFTNAYLHPADFNQSDLNVAPTLEFRKSFASQMLGDKAAPYNPDRDIRVWPCSPRLLPMEDGQIFDLGGRTVTAYHCPGHTPGEMVFVDSASRKIFCGDALNENFLLSSHLAPTFSECIRAAMRSLDRIAGMVDTRKDIYNGHCDYRDLGSPLKEDVLPGIRNCLEQMLNGCAKYGQKDDPLFPGHKQTYMYWDRFVVASLAGLPITIKK